jgi:hypothetical protein
MTMRSIACSACGADVPGGRLSCPACGELLAAVSGGRRDARPAAPPIPDDRPLVDALLDDDPSPAPGHAVSATGLDDGPSPIEASGPADPAPATDAGPDEVLAHVATSSAEDLVDDTLDDGPPSPAWPAGPVPSWPDRASTTLPAAAAAAAEPPPGAYLPPSPVAAPTPPAILGTAAIATMPAGPAAPARAWAGPSAAAGADDTAGEPETDAAGARARVDEAIGWVAVAGCAIALLGFLIPWARTMIGSSGDGYLDQWGLAGPGHLVIVIALVAIVIGAVIPNRIPAWLRLGVPGLVVGAILIGLLWPYVIGPLGTLPGAFLSLAGALTLVGASIASIVIDRHAARGPAV